MASSNSVASTMVAYAGIAHKKTSYQDLNTFVEQGRDALSHPDFADGVIHTAFKSIVLLEQAIANNPRALSACKTLFIESPDVEDLGKWGIERNSTWTDKCHALQKFLQSLAVSGRLRSFTWTWEGGFMDSGQPAVPEQVWEALKANAPSLESLNVDPTCADLGQCHKSWAAFSSDLYAPLRHLRLGLPNAHGGDGAPLRRMITSLSALISLNLVLAPCCGMEDITLASHNPNLKSFSLVSCILPNNSAEGGFTTEDFLKRHPTLEYIYLRYDHRGEEYSDGFDGLLKVDEGDLPNLRVLDISLETYPNSLVQALVSQPLEALYLQLDCQTGEKYLRILKPSIKSLALHLENFPVLPHQARLQTHIIPEVIQSLPNLVEMRVRYASRWGDHVPVPGNESAIDLFLARQAESQPAGEMSDPEDSVWSVPLEEDDEPENSEDNRSEYQDIDQILDGGMRDDVDDSQEEFENRMKFDDAGVVSDKDETRDGDRKHVENLRAKAKPRGYSGAELVKFFKALPLSAPSLRALIIEDPNIQPLDPELLNNMPCGNLPALQYLGWRGRIRSVLYELVRHEGGRVSAQEIAPLWTPPGRSGHKLWIDESILDLFGEAAHEW